MKKPCILRILSNVIQQQAELADILASPHIDDLSRKRRLHAAILANAAEFKRLVPEFQLQVERRTKLLGE